MQKLTVDFSNSRVSFELEYVHTRYKGVTDLSPSIRIVFQDINDKKVIEIPIDVLKAGIAVYDNKQML